MEKLNELKKPKHDHKGTDILKVLIFSLVMLAPFFAILSKCLYTLNPNAKDSYFGQTINETQYVNVDNTTINDKYVLRRTDDLKQNVSLSFIYSDITDVVFNTSSSVTDTIINNIDNIYRFRIYYNGSLYSLECSTNTTTYYVLLDQLTKINFYSTQTQNNLSSYSNNLYRIDFNDYSYIDNVFYYSVEQLGNEQLFSWTKSTAIYGAVNGLTSGMGIDPTNNVLAILITYWSLTTAVYVVMDIVIELFKKLTHLIN